VKVKNLHSPEWVDDGGRKEEFGRKGGRKEILGRLSGRKEFLTPQHQAVYEAIAFNPKTKVTELMDNIGISERTAYRIISDLKDADLIERQGGRKQGQWLVKLL
jgi:predicted HTH transcriptional regulator